MSYMRNPRCPLLWESDGDYNGKYLADDGTLHEDANAVLKYERERYALRQTSGAGLRGNDSDSSEAKG